MAATEVQFSGYISSTTKELVDRYVEEHGLKKGRLLEDALLHHLQALRELPVDLIIPARVLVSTQSWATIVKRMNRPRKPTRAMLRLFEKK